MTDLPKLPWSCVSLDLETTGLSYEQDDIIEIGAVKFEDGEVVDRFNTLVDPHRPVPPNITALTGITSEDVTGAPSFADVAEDLVAFLGPHPIVGQNVFFDLAFLANKGIRPLGPAFDTAELAQVLMPTLPDHSLSRLSGLYKVTNPRAHRALADAETTFQVFNGLIAQAAQLDPALGTEMVRLTAKSDWPMKHLFQALWGSGDLRLRAPTETGPDGVDGKALQERLKPPDPLSAKTKPDKLDLRELETLMSEGGPLAQSVPGFEQRPEQQQMMAAVVRALNEGGEVLVEAGTGVGKSLAYLLPAVLYAARNSATVVVSTNTINLQEQLVGKDLPTLLTALRAAGRPLPDDFQFMQLKGRGNYMCLKRWQSLRRSESLTAAEVKLLCRTLVWLAGTETGDRSELSLTPAEHTAWGRLSADGLRNPATECPFYRRGACFLSSNRRRAAGSHILVVNHALLLSDAARERGILPSYDHLIVDEAHNLEEVATQQFGSQVTPSQVDEFLTGLGPEGRAGLPRQVLARLKRADVGASIVTALEEAVAKLTESAARARLIAGRLFDTLTKFVLAHSTTDGGDYARELRMTRNARNQPAWTTVEQLWEDLDLLWQETSTGLSRLNKIVEDLDERQVTDRDGALLDLSAALQSGGELFDLLGAFILHPDKEFVYWASVDAKTGNLSLRSAPMNPGNLLQERLFAPRSATILTSATLAVNNRFSYIKGRLGVEEAEELQLGTPFDYEQAALLYLPQDAPEPDAPGYKAAVEQSITALAKAARGRTLALFTSHAALRGVYQAIAAALAPEEIRVLGQGIDGAPRQILSAFRANAKSVLLGTSSFWEGVDIAGETLSCLAVVRLPFGVPSDPVYAARAEGYEDPFNEYAVPQAVLRFKQGFGRLIRTRTDRGVVLALDRRLQTRSYGRIFLNSIPKCATRVGPLSDLEAQARAWLRLKRAKK